MNLRRFALLVSICALSGCLSPDEAHEAGADQAPVEQVAEQQATSQQGETIVARDAADGVVVYETEGNLESTHDVGCIPLSEVENRFTPADLYPGVAACMEQGNVENGAALMFLAGIYSQFDMNRITDSTARQAADALIIRAIVPLPDETKDPVYQEVHRVLQDPQALAAMCASISEVGPPDYHPRYMIQHGMKAANIYDTDPDLVEDFDATAIWTSLMSLYLHCPDA
jgi:hypothetical protein